MPMPWTAGTGGLPTVNSPNSSRARSMLIGEELARGDEAVKLASEIMVRFGLEREKGISASLCGTSVADMFWVLAQALARSKLVYRRMVCGVLMDGFVLKGKLISAVTLP